MNVLTREWKQWFDESTSAGLYDRENLSKGHFLGKHKSINLIMLSTKPNIFTTDQYFKWTLMHKI